MRKLMKVATLALLVLFAAMPVFAAGPAKVTPITLLLLGNKPTNGRIEAALAEINKLIGPRIGAELKVQYIEWADWQNQYQLALASGDSNIDLVITATDWLFAREISRKGGFYPLTPALLKANAPKTWAAVSPAHWDLCTENGKIWFIPEDQYSQYTNHGVYWRKDWAAEGGVTEVKKFADLEKYFDAVKKNHPEAFPWDVSGKESAFGQILYGYLLSSTPAQTILGCSTGNHGIFWYNTKDPYTVVSPFMDGKELIDAAQTFDRWATKGVWREDVLNYQGQTREEMYDGLSGADQHHTQTYVTQTRPQMDKRQPGSELQFYYFGMENKNVNKDLQTHGAMAVNAASKNAAKALQVYELLRNDKQIYMFFNYGIEGVDYVMKSGNVLDRPEGWDVTKQSLDSNFWGGRMDAFEPLNAQHWADKNKLYAEYAKFAMEYPLEKFAFNNTKVAAEMAAIGDVCSTYMPALAYGKSGDPVKAVNDFRAALKKAGYDKVKAEIQSQLTAFKKANKK
ncbi:MAG: ABC transporter substrate-binding protein [Spirochaetaceae bacterium]|nr:ABC transporter substrate-binding protein [Spirochaetaceae bacterium]